MSKASARPQPCQTAAPPIPSQAGVLGPALATDEGRGPNGTSCSEPAGKSRLAAPRLARPTHSAELVPFTAEPSGAGFSWMGVGFFLGILRGDGVSAPNEGGTGGGRGPGCLPGGPGGNAHGRLRARPPELSPCSLSHGRSRAVNLAAHAAQRSRGKAAAGAAAFVRPLHSAVPVGGGLKEEGGPDEDTPPTRCSASLAPGWLRPRRLARSQWERNSVADYAEIRHGGAARRPGGGARRAVSLAPSAAQGAQPFKRRR